jgi:hypothetical protein
VHALHHGRLDGQRMLRHAGQRVRRGRALFDAAKVERARQLQRLQTCVVGRRQVGQVVGAEQAAPAQRAAAVADVAAEVAEVRRTLQAPDAVGVSWHARIVAPQRSDGV